MWLNITENLTVGMATVCTNFLCAFHEVEAVLNCGMGVSVCSQSGFLCRSVFCDFGEKFTVFDTNGEPLRTCIVSHISKAEQGVVTVHDDQRHDLEDGEYVTFEEVEVRTSVVCVCMHVFICLSVCVCVH